MSKKIVVIILIIFLITFNSICNAEVNGYKVIIEDDAEILNENEEIMLETEMTKLTEYGNILFKTILTNPSYSTAQYASDYYHSKCGKESGTLFLIDLGRRNIYIFSDGNNYASITKSKAETITDNIYMYASKEQYYQCASRAYAQMLTILEGGKIAEPMRYASAGFIAVMISLFLNFVIFKKASKNKGVKTKELIDECERLFEHTPPIAIETGEHREYSPVERSSGGGFSSGGGGGGRFWTEEVAGGRRRSQLLNNK